jgi:hypothetical protein
VQLLDGSRLDAIEMVAGPVTVGAPSIMAGKDFLARDKVIELDQTIDPYVYVISANVHRRHLTAERKRELIAKLLEAQPEKSDRQIAEMAQASPTTVGDVRREKSTVQPGQLPPKRIGKDGKARQQPPRRRRAGPRNLERAKIHRCMIRRAERQKARRHISRQCQGTGRVDRPESRFAQWRAQPHCHAPDRGGHRGQRR